MDLTADSVDRVSDRAPPFADGARRDVIHSGRSNTLRHLLSFSAGVGIGVPANLLLAAHGGAELRDSLSAKVKDISDSVRGRNETTQGGTDTR